MESTIKLFNALVVPNKSVKLVDIELLTETLSRGFLFSPEVIAHYSTDVLLKMTKEIGLTAVQMNSSFHKSWTKVAEASDEQLFMEQMIHYFTTYGFESLGIYDSNSVYIPNEDLEIPSLKEDVKLMVIVGLTINELKEKLLKFLSSGIALKEDTIKAVFEVALLVGINAEEIGEIKNKEVGVMLYNHLNLVPQNPVEFLRYVVYKSTEETLLIKSMGLTEKIKDKSNTSIVKYFDNYENEVGLDRLAEIFYRFKPIFLAFRTNKPLKKIINKIRRQARKHHKPMKEDYLNSITGRLKNNKSLDYEKFVAELEKVNIFRKIRLAYALKYRTQETTSILYRIRNGKGFAKEFNFESKIPVQEVLDVVLDSIAKNIRTKLHAQKVYLPDNINYTLPSTEKQFVGNVPAGSYVAIPEDMVVGVHWDNVKNNRIDLDLSLINMGGEKFGWDSSYRSEGRDILFSGDVTDAPNGASELYSVQKQSDNAMIMMLNYYNFSEKVDVPFKIIVAKEEVSDMTKNYMVNPNNVLATIPAVIDKSQKVLGLLTTTKEESRFYFAEIDMGSTRTSGNSKFVQHSRQYLLDFYSNTIGLRDILERAGVVFVDEAEEGAIDLSIETLEKDTILNLLT